MPSLLRLLMFLYLPFLAVVWLATVALALLLMSAAMGPGGIVVMILIGFLLFSAGHLLYGLMPLMGKAPKVVNLSERPLPLAMYPKLHALVWHVAQEWGLPRPDEIRMDPDTIAHVHEDSDGRRILAIGGIALGTLTQTSLAGIIAHELGHFAAGDTALSRRGYRQLQVLGRLEGAFQAQIVALVNPLIWLVRAYHWLYMLTYFANSRDQEYAADRYSVAQVGADATAATLVLFYATNRLPWLRLESIAETHAMTNTPLEQIFEEQRTRARSIRYSEWEEAVAKALKDQTGFFDSHPSLRDRLRAVGVKPKKALKIAISQTGEPACDLIPGWPKLAKELTESWIAEMRQYRDAKMDVAQIIVGRPISRS